jgi:hypothetical protein
MQYSRENPSARYRELIRMYQDMHVHGERFKGVAAQDTFDGRSLRKEVVRIKRLIDQTGALTILDYGSGKGGEYEPRPLVIKGQGEWDSVIDYWGIDEVTCYDPAYAPYSTLPSGRFDGVVCTDVLEHCPEEDIDWIVPEIFSFAERFVYLAVACYPAKKRLPNGENAHCTIQPPEWWRGVLLRAASERPGVVWETWLEPEEGGKTICIRGGTAPAR